MIRLASSQHTLLSWDTVQSMQWRKFLGMSRLNVLISFDTQKIQRLPKVLLLGYILCTLLEVVSCNLWHSQGLWSFCNIVNLLQRRWRLQRPWSEQNILLTPTFAERVLAISHGSQGVEAWKTMERPCILNTQLQIDQWLKVKLHSNCLLLN